MAECSILDYGAREGGEVNCAAAIQAAIDAVHAQGGGRVRIPAGRFLSGSVLIKSNVDLHLESGAVLISSLKEEDISRSQWMMQTRALWTDGAAASSLGQRIRRMSPSPVWARLTDRATRCLPIRMWIRASMSAPSASVLSVRA